MSESAIIISSFNNVSTDPSKLIVNFPYQQNFKNKELALSNLIMNYSWFSITTAYANNTLSYKWTNGTTYNITLPDGFYRSSPVNDINAYIQLKMKSNGHYLVDETGDDVFYISIDLNVTYYAFTLTCTPVPSTLPTNWTNPASVTLNGFVPQLIIDNSGFKSIIGFNAGTYPAASNTSTTYEKNSDIAPQVSPTIAVCVSCNLVSNTGLNIYPSCISVLTPTVTFGSQIIERPSRPTYFPIADGSYSQIVVSFTDQNNRPLLILDPTNTVIQLLLRDRRK